MGIRTLGVLLCMFWACNGYSHFGSCYAYFGRVMGTHTLGLVMHVLGFCSEYTLWGPVMHILSL
jgi:hypothetical protein